MLFALRSKSTLDSLRENYTKLMGKSFKVSLKNRKKSNEIQEEAKCVLQKIRTLESSN